MARMIWLALIPVVAACAQVELKSTASVKLTVFDTFGQRTPGCTVIAFIEADHVAEIGRGHEGDWDRASLFDGLVGHEVPVGRYRAAVRCDPGDWRADDWVEVRAPISNIMLVMWRHKGDYHTGVGPRLIVSSAGGGNASRRWAKVAGVYSGGAETAEFDPGTATAEFYNLIPGRYLLLILEEAKTVCATEIDFLDAPASIRLGPGCRAESVSGIRISRPQAVN